MGRQYDDKLVQCPYFVRQDATRIHCEGWTEQSRTTNITAFANQEDRRTYTREHCNSAHWDRCPLCRLIASKYVDD